MRTLAKKYLGGLPVEEDSYKVDLAFLERYQAFSSELLRLALLGIAGYGFLIANVAFVANKSGEYKFFLPFSQDKALVIAGAIALAASAAAAPGYRYLSTGCTWHFVRHLRLSQSIKDLPAGEATRSAERTIEHEEASLDRDVKKCRWLLVIACSSLAVAVVCTALAFALILFNAPPLT
jgi:hypothetical protein